MGALSFLSRLRLLGYHLSVYPRSIIMPRTKVRNLRQNWTLLANPHRSSRLFAAPSERLRGQAFFRPLPSSGHRSHSSPLEAPHRPLRPYVRGHPQWRELFPHLKELGIDVSVRRELSRVQKAYENHLRQMRETHRAGILKPTGEQVAVERLFPAIAKWVGVTGISRSATRSVDGAKAGPRNVWRVSPL